MQLLSQFVISLQVSLKMEIEFYITEDGTIMIRDDNGNLVSQDIIFKFSGDDDFMAYIDGHLALDIAGIHNPLYGEINFNSGNILTHPLNEDFTPNETQTHMQTNLYEIESDGQRLFTKENYFRSVYQKINTTLFLVWNLLNM